MSLVGSGRRGTKGGGGGGITCAWYTLESGVMIIVSDRKFYTIHTRVERFSQRKIFAGMTSLLRTVCHKNATGCPHRTVCGGLPILDKVPDIRLVGLPRQTPCLYENGAADERSPVPNSLRASAFVAGETRGTAFGGQPLDERPDKVES